MQSEIHSLLSIGYVRATAKIGLANLTYNLMRSVFWLILSANGILQNLIFRGSLYIILFYSHNQGHKATTGNIIVHPYSHNRELIPHW